MRRSGRPVIELTQFRAKRSPPTGAFVRPPAILKPARNTRFAVAENLATVDAAAHGSPIAKYWIRIKYAYRRLEPRW
jgi:hypothetical protein